MFTITIVVFLLLCSQGIQAKVSECKDDGDQTKLDQIELFKQFVGTWKLKVGNDTIITWEIKRFEKAYVSFSYRIVKGKKELTFIQGIGFSKSLDKFKGLAIRSNGFTSGTFIASFTSENKWTGQWVRNFNPEEGFMKFEIVLESPTNFVVTSFNAEGEKTSVDKWYKEK